MSTALSKAEQNALAVSYDVNGHRVELDLEFAKRYLVRGNAELVSDQEILFFMNTCKSQKLNPLVGNEVYCIKYSKGDPAQVVVGKGAYLRRAFEHPDYLCKEDGITVKRGNEYIQKEGCCPYPNEELIGGWCRVHYLRDGKERTAFKEVLLGEYDKGMANWKSKPATMINKVAVSQCVREAFPKDYDGLYSEEEMVASGAIPVKFETVPDTDPETGEVVDGRETVVSVDDPPITHDQRMSLFGMAKTHLGPNYKEILRAICTEYGVENTEGMPLSAYNSVTQKIMELAMAGNKENAGEEAKTEASAE